MSSGNFGLMCCICFKGLTPDECAEYDGHKWDQCVPCAVINGFAALTLIMSGGRK